MSTAAEERAWWDEIALTPDLDRNIYDTTIGTTDECCHEILTGLTPLPVAPGPVLDLGCGVGRVLGAFARALPDHAWVGVDISPNILDHASRRLVSLRNAHLAQGDGRTIPYDDDTFGAAYSMLMFQHIPAHACAGYLFEIARVLRSGARFRFQCVVGDWDGFLSHQTSDTEMCGWCEDAGLIVLGSEVSRLHWEWRWMTARKP